MKKDGYWSGYGDYRYGERRPVTLAGQKPKAKIQNEAKRKHLISRVIDGMRDWRCTPFENEGPMRAGLRSGFCSMGHGWGDADKEADVVISHALRRIGAVRPTWDEGQPSHTDSPDFCSWCRGPMDDEDRTRGQRFCSAECAAIAIQQRDRKSNKYMGTVLRSAVRLVTKATAPPRDCEYCGDTFRSDREDARFCSPVCVSRWQKGDLLLKDIVCQGCGKTAKPSNRGARFCSHSCASAVHHRQERERLASETRICACCGDGFAPTTESTIYCSRRCSSTAASRLHYQRNRAEHHLACQWCGTGYVSKMPWSTTCGAECRQAINGLSRPRKRPLAVNPRLFDYVFRMAA